MSVQFLMDGEEKRFAVIPYGEYEEMQTRLAIAQKRSEQETRLPIEIVEMNVLQGYSLIKAWRLYLNKTQKEVALKLGITQSAFSQMEKSNSNQWATLQRIADIFNIQPEQLTLD